MIHGSECGLLLSQPEPREQQGAGTNAAADVGESQCGQRKENGRQEIDR